MDLDKVVIQMINTSSKILDAMLKTCKTFYKSKPLRSRSPDAKTNKTEATRAETKRWMN